ncbi:WXG100 family type VII secretion target [Streptomyces sp. NPDC127066]|uniref:WXG100 family type VII secretion target n=1 Tax=Streptomyces sp. NPDC127066 TaxID=3347125 RepID=UPI0036517B20
MTARPRDWTPMYDSDPVPGDPHEVARLGKELRGMAEEIDKQARNIRALASVDGWDSDAGRAFHETAGDTAGRLKKAYDRYDEASKALGTQVRDGESDEYAGELHRAQRMADGALDDFRAAEVDHKAALKVLEPYTGTVPSQDDHVERTKQEKKRDDAAHLMAVARSKIESAKEIRDDAAKRAAHRIKNVIHHDGVHDPGGVMNWIADHADWFSAAATILAVVALGAAIIFTGGLAAPIIAGIAAALSATALSGRLYDVFARGGEFDALKIGFDVLGLFPGFGVLRGLSAGAKGGRLLAAQAGLWEKFSNGLGVKGINGLAKVTSKWLVKRGVTKVRIPEQGFKPEVVTRYIKGTGLAHLYVKTLDRLSDDHPQSDVPHTISPPPGDVRPTPAPDKRPSAPEGHAVPSPTPQPSPSSSSFRAALAPVR